MPSDPALEALLAECAARGLALWAEGDQLRLRGPKGSAPRELLARLGAAKPGLLDILSRQASGTAPEFPRRELMRAPLSPAQRRLWFLSRLEGASPLFNLPAALVLEGPLDPARLAAALAEVVGRQTALRTAIPERDGEPWQEVLPLPGPELARRDFSDAPDTLAAFDRIAEEEARRPFDLAAGPLCRALLCRLGPARHGLVLVVHHLVADYHAMGLVLEELAAAYARRAGDQAPPPPPPPPPRYTDYAAWRAAGDDPARTEAALRDCAELLAGAPPLLTLPGDRPRPAVASGRGGCLGFTVPAGLAQKVAELGRGQGATPFMTWLALWGLLLARLAGQEEVTVGCPVSRRPPGAEGMVGLFLSTAVTRLSLAGAPSLAAYLARTRSMAARVLAHPEVPFDRLVERLAPERGLDHTPLFQAMFVLHQAPRPAPAWPGLAVSARPVANGAAEFDLNLALEPRADGALAGYLEYASDLFDPATVERWVGHLLVLAEAAVQRPDAPVGDLPLLTPAETAVLVREWSGAGSIPPAPAPPVPAGLGAAARRWPGAVAVADATGRASYGELAAWAGRLAAGLGRLGIGPGTRVGVLLPPGREWVAALWGVWWAGAALVSLDPAAPARRLGDLASRAGLAALIAREGAPAGPWRVLDPGELPAAPAPEPPSPAAGDPAYLVFTSGSTGAPKGILVSHGALAFHAAAAGRALGLVPGETVLQFASPAFDVAWEELWPALLAGGRVAVCPGAARESLAAFTDFLERERVAVANLPARFWEAWTEHLAGEGRAVPAGLRLLVTGSEAVNPAALARWRELPGGDRGFLSGYGPSEATVTASFYDPARDGEHPGPALPLGRPLPGVRALVLDERGRPVPPGCLGELCLGGPGLALGYLDPADQAAGAFAPDPFRPGERLYRSGDLARLRPPANGQGPGLLLFAGRRDLQIKRRGYRIEPGEIEAALLTLADVAGALVVPRPDGRLAALVEPAPGRRPEPEAMRAGLAATLPGYLLPDLIVVVPRLPLLASGKPDRHAAAGLAAAGGEAPAGEVPRPGTESLLAAIWGRVLGRDRIGREANFFRLGGDSILALKVAGQAGREGLALTPRDLFLAPTLAGLAARTRPLKAQAALPEAVAGPMPPTPVLAWFREQPAAFRERLVMSLPLKLAAPPAPAALREALAALFARHDQLRLRMTPEGGFSIAPPDPGEAARALWVAGGDELPRLAAEPFDLARGPLLRAILAAPDRLILQAHHLAVDAVSWGVILEDLAGLLTGEAAAPAPQATPGPAWAELLARAAAALRPREELARLAGLAAGIEPLAAPAGEAPGEALVAEVELPPAALARLLAPPRPGATRPEELILAGVGLALARRLGRPAWLMEVEGHGRELPAPFAGRAEVARAVGWFTSLSPARFDPAPFAEDPAAFAEDPAAPAAPGGPSPRAALLAARQALRSARAHALGPGLLARLHPDPAVRQRAAALAGGEVLYNYLGALDRGLPAGLALDPAPPAGLPEPALSHPLEINAFLAGGRGVVRLALDPTRWPRGFGEALAEELPGCLAEVAAAGGELPPVPADFPLAEAAGLAQPALAAILARLGGPPEDLYPLSPLQGGMLFHTLRDERSGEYFDQFTCLVEAEGFSPERFREAWQRLLARHGALRAAFLWEGLREPLQAVVPAVAVPLTTHDWRGLDPGEQEARLAALMAEDRTLPFALDRPPLMRLALCRLDERRWRLLWSNHHLILDGWSLPLVLEEVRGHYRRLARGLPADGSPGPAHREYLAWLRRQDREAALAFWREELKGFAAPTPLPPAAPEASPATGWPHEALRLPPEDHAAITAALRARGLTLSSLVQGAWALLLSRYGGGRDVLFGVTVAGRPAEVPGIAAMVASCINTLPARVAIPRGTPAGEWLAGLMAAQARRDALGFLDLAELTRLAELPPATPLFDSLVLVQNYPVDDPGGEAGPGLGFADFEFRERTNYGLTVVVSPLGRELLLSLAYDPARHGRPAARRILEHLRNLLIGLAREGDHPLDAIEMLSPAEIQRARDSRDGDDREYAWRGPWFEEFAAHAAARPEAPALIQGARVVSYRELDQSANRLAHRLRALGVGPETLVGLALPRSPEAVAAILGIHKAGGAYLPLDPDYPPERLARMLEDADPPVLVSQRELLPRFAGAGSRATLCPDRDAELLAGLPATPPPCAVGPAHLACVIYTSGSTGRPKGSLIQHGGLANLAQIQRRHFGVGPSSRVLQFFSLSFDAATWEILMALGAGAALCLGDRRELQPGPPLFAFLGRHRVTHMTLTPSALAVLPAPGEGELPALGVVITGGEGCDHRLASRWARDGRRFYHGYGPTETTICCSAPLCRDFTRPLPLGRPLPNQAMYVLDDRRGLCPEGVTGEIGIGGAGVSRGFLRRPGLSAAKFPPDPFAARPGARLYLSGDLGCYLPDGSILFQGRADHQVKIRGYRVEPGEVETVLAGHPAVRRALVVADRPASGTPRLLAYAAGHAAPPDPAELMAFLKARLPAYMVPAHVLVLEEFPLTANDKVDRAALPRPEEARAADAGRVLPATPLEERIAAVWREVLELSEVGVDENFFDLGGHSLLVVRACAALNQALGADLTVVELFDLPTVRQLAARLGDNGAGSGRLPAGAALAAQKRGEGQDRLGALRNRRGKRAI